MLSTARRRVVVAGVAAAVLSGVPSSTWALLTGDDVLAAARAAGTLAPGGRPGLIRGLAVHAVVSAFWTAVFVVVARRCRLGIVGGALGGLAIAFVDMGVVGRRYPAIASLPQAPQWADHVAFGAVLGYALGEC